MLAGSILSVVFARLAVGPEVLGYASTVLRDSRFVDLPPDTGSMSRIDVSLREKGMRVRYGFTREVVDGEPLMGIGLQESTEPIGGSLTRETGSAA